jgi:hypothetical protein
MASWLQIHNRSVIIEGCTEAEMADLKQTYDSWQNRDMGPPEEYHRDILTDIIIEDIAPHIFTGTVVSVDSHEYCVDAQDSTYYYGTL